MLNENFGGLLKGKNDEMFLALPIVGGCTTGLFAVVGSVSFVGLSVKGITGVFWVGCVMLINPCSVLSRKVALRLTWSMLCDRLI